MKKHAPKLFFVVAVLFYLTAFSGSPSRSAWVALGTVFLVLGIVNLRRAKADTK